MGTLPEDIAALCLAAMRMNVPVTFTVPAKPKAKEHALNATRPDFEMSIGGQVVGMVSGAAMRGFIVANKRTVPGQGVAARMAMYKALHARLAKP